MWRKAQLFTISYLHFHIHASCKPHISKVPETTGNVAASTQQSWIHCGTRIPMSHLGPIDPVYEVVGPTDPVYEVVGPTDPVYEVVGPTDPVYEVVDPTDPV